MSVANDQASEGQSGGGIFVSGDRNSAQGINGVPQNGTFASNAANLVCTNDVFMNLNVTETPTVPGSGIGGALGGGTSGSA